MIDKFFNAFLTWQFDHKCPNCKKPALDFTLNVFTSKFPIICTNCGKHYGFKEIK